MTLSNRADSSMSAKCQYRKSLAYWITSSAVHQRQLEAECPGRLDVDDELEFRRLLYRKVGWLFAFENAVQVGGSTLELVDAVNT
jgi:hypothetical protein